MVDTAAAYGNEGQVGEAIRQSDVSREDVFITTKLWISDYGYDQALHGFDRSSRKLGFDTVDLYLLHQPMPNEWERTVNAWKAAGRLLGEGRARAIGVSNFNSELLADLIERTGIVPHVNRVELHPSSRNRRCARRMSGLISRRRRGPPSGASPAIGRRSLIRRRTR